METNDMVEEQKQVIAYEQMARKKRAIKADLLVIDARKKSVEEAKERLIEALEQLDKDLAKEAKEFDGSECLLSWATNDYTSGTVYCQANT